MGMSFPEYLQSIRLNCAVSLIAGGEQSITEIAADSGFESQRTFYRAFRARFGITPCNTGNGFCSPAGRPRKNFMPSEGKPSFQASICFNARRDIREIRKQKTAERNTTKKDSPPAPSNRKPYSACPSGKAHMQITVTAEDTLPSSPSGVSF